MSTEMITSDAAEAVTALPRDLAIVKMENDQIFSLAAARPRNMDEIRIDLAEMITSFPQFADDAIYEKPVGKDPDTGKMKFARGLSVRAAETLAECYGFNRIHTDVECFPDGRVKIYASFTDYQKGRTWEDSTIVSPFYKGRNGAMQRHPEDRFLNVIVKSEKSKLVREVINRSVNQALKAWFENECEKQLSKTLDGQTIDKIVKGFEAYGMGLEQLEQVVGRAAAMGWTTQDKIRLQGVYTALKAGETTVAELLDQEQPARRSQTTSGTIDGLKNPKGAAENRPHQAESQHPVTAASGEPFPPAEQASAQQAADSSQEALVDQLLMAVSQAAKLADINFIEGRAKELNEDDAGLLVNACCERREQIKAKRGQAEKT